MTPLSAFNLLYNSSYEQHKKAHDRKISQSINSKFCLTNKNVKLLCK